MVDNWRCLRVQNDKIIGLLMFASAVDQSKDIALVFHFYLQRQLQSTINFPYPYLPEQLSYSKLEEGIFKEGCHLFALFLFAERRRLLLNLMFIKVVMGKIFEFYYSTSIMLTLSSPMQNALIQDILKVATIAIILALLWRLPILKLPFCFFENIRKCLQRVFNWSLNRFNWQVRDIFTSFYLLIIQCVGPNIVIMLAWKQGQRGIISSLYFSLVMVRFGSRYQLQSDLA